MKDEAGCRVTYKLSVGDNVDKDGLLVARKTIDDLGTLLQNLVILKEQT